MAGIVEFVAGPLFGLVGGVVTRWQDLEAQKVHNSHELKKFDFEIQMRNVERVAAQEKNEQDMAMNAAVTEADLAKFVTQGSYAGLSESLKHDTALQSGIPWIEGIRSLVRPILTLGAVGASTWLCFANFGNTQEAAVMTLLTNGSMAFAWWFGDRQAVKLNSRYLKG